MHAYSWVDSGCAAAAAVNAAIAAAVYAARLGSDGTDGCALSDRRPLSQTPVAGRVLGRWDLFRANVTEVVLIKDNNI